MKSTIQQGIFGQDIPAYQNAICLVKVRWRVVIVFGVICMARPNWRGKNSSRRNRCGCGTALWDGDAYERREDLKPEYRNGFYERDFATPFGNLRLRIARSRKQNFLLPGLQKFHRRGKEVDMLIREAFLRGISTRQVGRVIASLTGESVSAQAVFNLSRDLDQAVQAFQKARLQDDWAYLFLGGVSLRVRRPSGRRRVQMLVAYGVRRDGSRQLLAFLRSQGESQVAWEGLLNDLERRGLKGANLKLIITDGCAWISGCDSDGPSASGPSTLLGAQDAQHPGESAPTRLR